MRAATKHAHTGDSATRRIALGVGLIVFALATARLGAQAPVLSPSGFTTTLVAAGLTESGESMAVDRDQNIFIVHQLPSGQTTITKRSAAGVITPAFVTVAGACSKLHTSVLDGRVYFVQSTSTGGTVKVMDPNAGAITLFSINMPARALALSAANVFVFAGVGAIGDTLYALANPVFGSLNATTAIAPASPSVDLEFLPTGNLLAATAAGNVYLFIPPVVGTIWTSYFYSATPTFNCYCGTGGPAAPAYTVVDLARMPFNTFGVGSFVARNFGGAGSIYRGSAGADTGLFAYGLGPAAGARGLRAIATGPRRELYWYTEWSIAGVVSSFLYRVTENSAPGTPAALAVQTSAGSVTFSMTGSFATNGVPQLSTLTLGVAVTGTNAGAFYGTFGVFDLDPLAPSYIPVVDGLGLRGPPNPWGYVYGTATQTVAVPASVPTGIPIDAQFILLGAGPNGFAYESNLVPFLTP